MSTSKVITDRCVYDAYGNDVAPGLHNTTEGNSQRFRWNGSYGYRTLYLLAGAQTVPTATVMHVGARHYAPCLRRWLQRDPIDIRAGDANAYRYCYCDPVNVRDPLGFQGSDDPDALFDEAVKTGKQTYYRPMMKTAHVGAIIAGVVMSVTLECIEGMIAGPGWGLVGRVAFKGAVSAKKARLFLAAFRGWSKSQKVLGPGVRYITKEGLEHSFTHARDHFGLHKGANLTGQQVAAWIDRIKQATEKGTQFETILKRSKLAAIGHLVRYGDGSAFVVFYSKETGELVSAWFTSGEQLAKFVSLCPK